MTGFRAAITSNSWIGVTLLPLYTVIATVTVPVSCPNGTTENIVIPLGQPGVLDGGGATSVIYAIPAGDTQNHATNNQNSILAWEGAVQAPATLCGGQTGRNQVGAVFNITVATGTPCRARGLAIPLPRSRSERQRQRRLYGC